MTLHFFAVITLARLTELVQPLFQGAGLGDPEWNPDCNISIPADAFIDTRDLAALAGHWLEAACF